MFSIENFNVNEISSIEYHFEDENLNLEIMNPFEIKQVDNVHLVTDDIGCVFIIQPDWVYISIIRKPKI